MNGIWLDNFHGIIPRHQYFTHFSAGEAKGLIITLESMNTTVTIDFGAVHAVQILDEGVLLGSETEQLKALRENDFPSTIYEIKQGDFGAFVSAQMGSDLFQFLNCRQYNIVTYNYVIFIVCSWPPKINILPNKH